MPIPAGMVCGPITTGGRGSLEENLEHFKDTVRRLMSEGKNIYNQLPFENAKARLRVRTKSDSDHTILTDFYLPLFESGKINPFYFIPGWEDSTGASWEHEQAKRLGIDTVYLDV